MQLSGHRYDVRGLELAYQLWSAEQRDPMIAVQSGRPVILCLHGFLDHGSSFAEVATALAPDHEVLALDFRGFGNSGWLEHGYYYYPDYYGDVLALIERLAIPRLSIVGHSMGGGVATGVGAVLEDRLESLVLLEGMGPPVEDPSEVALDRLKTWSIAVRRPELDRDRAGRRAARAVIGSVEEAALRLRRSNPRLAESMSMQLAIAGTEPADGASPGGAVVWRFDPLHRTPSPRPPSIEESRALWRAVRAPVLALYGAESEWRFGDLPDRHKMVPRILAGEVAGAGHNLHHDQPTRVAAAIRAWVGGAHDVLPQGILPFSPRN